MSDSMPLFHGSLLEGERTLASLVDPCQFTVPSLPISLMLTCQLCCLWSPAGAATAVLPSPLRSATWIDSDGQTFRMADLGSRWVVMTMAYTACRRTCSTSTLVLQDIERQMNELQQQASFVIVSFDPANDSPSAWQDYRRKRQLMGANWHFLSGSAADTQRLSQLLDLNPWSYHGHIVHDFRILVFDQRWRTAFELNWDQVDQLPRLLKSAARTLAP